MNCELVLNKPFYLQKNSAKEASSRNVLVGTSHSYNCVPATIGHDDFADLVFNEECLSTAHLTSFSSMWHVHGLSTVLKRPIMSIYPLFNSRIRPTYHRLIYPRNMDLTAAGSASIPQATIMWTRVSPLTSSTGPWSPNHFVPCLPKQTSAEVVHVPSVSSIDTKPECMLKSDNIDTKADSIEFMSSEPRSTCIALAAIEQKHLSHQLHNVDLHLADDAHGQNKFMLHDNNNVKSDVSLNKHASIGPYEECENISFKSTKPELLTLIRINARRSPICTTSTCTSSQSKLKLIKCK